jgi:uncharacterized membrane protein SirB2
MNTGELLNLSLVLHIIGLATVGGSNLATFVMQGQSWKQYAVDKSKGIAIMTATSKVARITMIGFLLLILSGISMMVITQGAFGMQFWFRVKMIVLLIIIILGVTFGRRAESMLGKLMLEDNNGKDMTSELRSTRRRIRLFYIIQLSLLVIIFVLSVFKFN